LRNTVDDRPEETLEARWTPPTVPSRVSARRQSPNSGGAIRGTNPVSELLRRSGWDSGSTHRGTHATGRPGTSVTP